jgi:hypothetical protein
VQQQEKHMKRQFMIAAALTAMVAGVAATSVPAQASWAESANGNAVYTGTNQSLRHSERARQRFSYRSHRSWDQGYSSYGGYEGSAYGGYYR